MVERYEGSREQEAIHIGQHIWHKRWGEGVITKTTEEELLDQGIKPNTIRLSIGTEHIDDIIDDLEEAFAAVR